MLAELLVYKGGGTILLLGGRGSGKAVLVKAITEQAGRIGHVPPHSLKPLGARPVV